MRRFFWYRVGNDETNTRQDEECLGELHGVQLAPMRVYTAVTESG